jgi:Mechanosensitive ion channel, conserved TM helix
MRNSPPIRTSEGIARLPPYTGWHDFRLAVVAQIQGVSVMPTILAALIQLSGPQAQQPLTVDHLTLWHHMSDALDQSLDRVLSLLIAVLPGILAFFVAVGVFALIGALFSWLLRRGLSMAKFDDRIARYRGNADWTPMNTPIAIAGRVCFWGCVLIGLMIGVSAFDTSYATAGVLPVPLLPYLARIVGAGFILIVGTLVARFLSRSVLIGAVNMQVQYARFLALGVKWLVLVLTAAMALAHLEIGGPIVELAFGILFGGIVLTLALAVGLGSRDLVSRSLESHVERSSEQSPEQSTTSAGESFRHF